MDDLRELYQSVILDHNKNPHNFGADESANRSAEGFNPICGDQLKLYLQVDEAGTVVDAHFDGAGCAISTASASLMTDYVKGKSGDEIETLFESFHGLVTTPPGEDNSEIASELGKLAVFSGVRDYPMRIKCATLCWHTLRAALDQAESVAQTE
jgi:nitrogen fixation NifU-like protein